MESLAQELKKILRNAKRVAVLGVGSELRGDDAAGICIARKLDARCKPAQAHVKVFIGDTAPENLTGEIKRFKPTHIVIVDTARLDMPAGRARLIDPDEVGGASFCTHSLPLKTLSDYLRQSLGCTIAIIGIQPKALEFGSGVSKEMKGAIARIGCLLSNSIAKRPSAQLQSKKRTQQKGSLL